jgi:hypothetical protein
LEKLEESEVWNAIVEGVADRDRGAEYDEGSLTSGVIALLTGPHQISFSELGSLTIRLSRGDRPVFAPEYAVRAPVDVMAEPVS